MTKSSRPSPIQIAYRQSSPGPALGETAAGRRADTLEFSVANVPEKQRLLSIARAPLMRIDCRIDVTINDKEVLPGIVVKIDKAGSPAQKWNTDLTQARSGKLHR